MTDFNNSLHSSANETRARERALAACYRAILSWSHPQKKTEPATDLDGDQVAGSENSFINPYTPKSGQEPDE